MKNTMSYGLTPPALSLFIFLSFLSLSVMADDSPLTQGIQFFDKGNNEQAVQFLTKAARQDPQSAKAFYYLGLAASKQNNYAKAVAAFKKTIEINSALPEVHLALGVSYYRLGLNTLALHTLKQELKINAKNSSALYFSGLVSAKNNDHQKAIAYFEKVASIDKEFQQMAVYNIALSHLAQDNNELATQALQQTVNLDSNTDLAKNARSMLNQLMVNNEFADKKRFKSNNKPWLVSAKTGFEFDDNVTVSDIDTTTGIEDVAATFEFSGSYKIIEQSGFELEAEYNLYQSLYKELSEFDLQSHSFLLSAAKEFKNVDNGLNYSYNLTFLGGKRFFETQSITPYVGFMPLSNWYVTLNYSYKHKNFFAVNERDANQNGMGLSNYIFFNDAQSHALLSYRFEDENTQGSSFDYQGHYFTTALKSKFSNYSLSPKTHINYEYYFKDYESVTPSISQIRSDERHTISLGLSLTLNKYVNANMEYQYIESNSNLEFSDFNENIVTFDLAVTY